MKKRLFSLSLILTLLLTMIPGCATAGNNGEAAAPGEEVIGAPSIDSNTPDTPAATPGNTTPNDQPQSNQTNTNNGTSANTNTNTNTNTESAATNPERHDELNLWVSPVLGKKQSARPFYAVKWMHNDADNRYYLYLPTEGDLSSMQVWFAGTEDCLIGDQLVEYGQTISSLKPGNYTVTLDWQEYPLTIMKSANIGSMYVTTKSGSMSYIHKEKGNEETGMMRYVDADGRELYFGNLTQIRGRGNATWSKEKKPYQIKLESKAELVAGAGEATTWLLLANYCEKTMINNTVALDLAYDAGLTDSARFEYMDLYCNGKYMGTYQVCEKVQIAKNRLEYNDLDKTTQKVNSEELETYSRFGTSEAVAGSSMGYNVPNDPDDITGAYLLEIEANDRYANETAGFVTNGGVAVVIKEPSCPSAAQVAYISNYFQEFEDAIRAEDGINPTTGKRFDQYFDLTSLAKKYILEEYVKNIDADKTSQYFYKPSDTESTVGFCGPVWDYDNSFDVMVNASQKEGLYAAKQRKKVFYYLCKHDLFMDEVKKHWKNEYLPAIAVCLGEKRDKNAATQSLDYYYKLLTPSAAMNYTRWDGAGGVTEPINSSHVDTGDTYLDHYNYLRDYLTDRRFELNQIWMSTQ